MESHWQQVAENKERTYFELVEVGASARPVVLVLDVGRWSEEAKIFVRLLARARPDQNHDSCDVTLNKRGNSSGTDHFMCRSKVVRCFVAGSLRGGMGQMGKRLRLTRSSGIRQRPLVNQRPPELRCWWWMSF